MRLANPEIVEASTILESGYEASPNLPGVSADVSRPDRVRVRFLDAEGEDTEREFTGLWARSVQHQIDHLDGRLYVDRLGPVKRRMLVAKALKRSRRRG